LTILLQVCIVDSHLSGVDHLGESTLFLKARVMLALVATHFSRPMQFNAVAGVVILACIGCADHRAGELVSARFEHPGIEANLRGRGTSQKVVDLGVVFAQRGGRFVFPYEDFGLAESAEVASVQSSCECVLASPAHFMGTGGTASALEITVQPESRPARAPQRLRVLLDIELAGGASHQATVDLLCTNPASSKEAES